MPKNIISIYFRCINRRNDLAKKRNAEAIPHKIDPKLQTDIITVKKLYKDFVPITNAFINKILKYDTFIKNKPDIKREC